MANDGWRGVVGEREEVVCRRTVGSAAQCRVALWSLCPPPGLPSMAAGLGVCPRKPLRAFAPSVMGPAWLHRYSPQLPPMPTVSQRTPLLGECLIYLTAPSPLECSGMAPAIPLALHHPTPHSLPSWPHVPSHLIFTSSPSITLNLSPAAHTPPHLSLLLHRPLSRWPTFPHPWPHHCHHLSLPRPPPLFLHPIPHALPPSASFSSWASWVVGRSTEAHPPQQWTLTLLPHSSVYP